MRALINGILGGDESGRDFPPFASAECPFRHVQQGRALRLIVGNASITTDASRQAILKAIARARQQYEQITTGKATNIAQLAGIDGVSCLFQFGTKDQKATDQALGDSKDFKFKNLRDDEKNSLPPGYP